MAEYAEGRQINIQSTGKKTEIPNNSYAKIMYYLDCVNGVINVDFGSLTDYTRYREIDAAAKSELLYYAQAFDPATMRKLGVFVLMEDEDAKSIGALNDFFKITDQKVQHLHIPSTLTIGTHQVTVAKVMFAADEWFMKYYFNPVDTIISLGEKEIQQSQMNETCECIAEVFCCGCDCCDFDWCHGCGCFVDNICCTSVATVLFSIIIPPLGLLLLFIGCCNSEPLLRCCAAYGTIIGVIMYIIILAKSL